jgi:hypothetical protein
MSDFVSVINIGDRILHCVDYDRPVWLPAGDMSQAIVPSRGHFVADALIAFASELLDLDTFSWNRYRLDNKQFPDDGDSPESLAAARAVVYAAEQPGLLHVALEPIDRLTAEDLARLSMRVTLAEVTRDSTAKSWP